MTSTYTILLVAVWLVFIRELTSEWNAYTNTTWKLEEAIYAEAATAGGLADDNPTVRTS